MDENTRMMMQVAGLMMQKGQNMARPSPTVMQMAQNSMLEMARQILSTEQPNTNPNQALLTELAKQIVVSADNAVPIAPGVHARAAPTPRPATVAQLTQQQPIRNVAAVSGGTGMTSEGQIFVYQQDPDHSHPINNTDGIRSPQSDSMTSIGHDRCPLEPFQQDYSMSGGGPMRTNRVPSTRILRPGVDNFGRFGSVANPGLIMHAMDLMRRKDKKKRGPKEKETFPLFMYCLPDKNSKLPKFSSLDPVERCLVDQHQQEGYGYPSQDYINGIPRKTQLCLTFTPEKFHSFMVGIYPKLEDMMYDMYRIDKTRRLIRIDASSPRELKDMRYQGSVIIIPYKGLEDRPAPIIHRNLDDCYLQTGRTNAAMPNFSVPLPSLPEALSDVMHMSHDYHREQPVFPGQPVSMTLPTQDPDSQDSGNSPSQEETSRTESQGSFDDSRTTGASNAFDTVRILVKAGEMRSQLKEVKHVNVKPETLYADILEAYRKDHQLEQHSLSVSFNRSHLDDTGPQDEKTVDPGSLLVLFWEEVFRTHFQGDQEQVPVLDPSLPTDLFTLLGRILHHGLVLENYMPLNLSMACVIYLFTDNCSDVQLLSSLYRVMSEAEKDVLETALNEARVGADQFSPQIESSLRVILGSYGCKRVPSPQELERTLNLLAKSFLIHQPYWPLLRIQEGFYSATSDAFLGMKEEDVVALYQALTPVVSVLLDRVVYTFSRDHEVSSIEQQVKEYFEQYMFKLSHHNLLRLLYKWCGYDCLCITELHVRFSGDHSSQVPLFSPGQATLCLPSSCTSGEELKQLLESHVPSSSFLDA